MCYYLEAPAFELPENASRRPAVRRPAAEAI